jgi:hypothetical protein
MGWDIFSDRYQAKTKLSLHAPIYKSVPEKISQAIQHE